MSLTLFKIVFILFTLNLSPSRPETLDHWLDLNYNHHSRLSVLIIIQFLLSGAIHDLSKLFQVVDGPKPFECKGLKLFIV